MKIALAAPSAIPARTANSIQTMKMSQAFVQAGHEFVLYVPGTAPQDPWGTLKAHYGLDTEFKIEWLPVSRRARGYDYAWRAVSVARRWGAQVFFTRLPQGAALASRLGLPTIFEAHDMPQGRMGPVLLRQFLRGRGAARLVSITRALADDLQAAFPIPQGLVVISPDGVDIDRYQNLPAPQEARYKVNLPENFTVGYTGHLYAGRGVGLIMEMAAAMPEVNFLLVGGEPKDVAHWQKKVEDDGLENVFLTGFVPNAQLPLYQAACDVLLMPYQKRVAGSSGGDIARYLSPMKMFEYLACGRAVAASDLPVLREVLKANNSVTVRSDRAEAWVEALRELEANPEARGLLAENARRTAEGYTWQARVQTLLSGLG